MDDISLRSSLEGPHSPDTSATLAEIRENIQRLQAEIAASIPPNQLSISQVGELLENLPRLSEQEVSDLGHHDALCPICLNPLVAILVEEEMAIAMDSPAHPIEDLGVTKLSQPWQCGHIFCRRDISKWIRDAHDSCPLCRSLFIEPGARVPAATPELDPGLSELGVQIGHHIHLLRAHLEGIPSSLPENESDSSRNTFSGMYS